MVRGGDRNSSARWRACQGRGVGGEERQHGGGQSAEGSTEAEEEREEEWQRLGPIAPPPSCPCPPPSTRPTNCPAGDQGHFH